MPAPKTEQDPGYSLGPKTKYAIRFPIEIKPARNRVELTEQLVNLRNYFGLSQAELEFRSGMQDGYCSKLEKPFANYGRCAFHNSIDDWLGGLDVVVLILPRSMFQGLEPHVRAPAPPRSTRPSWGADEQPGEA